MSEKIHQSLGNLQITSEGTYLSAYDWFSFDTEGVNLSKTGELTVATIQGFQGRKILLNISQQKESPIYVIDVQVLGGDVVFSKGPLNLRSILEDSNNTKVTFDCRGDSDALYHQFGVTLAGAFEIYDQAVRIHNGELPPAKNEYICKGKTLLSNMEEESKRYSIETSMNKSRAPHRYNASIWKQRPPAPTCIEYAANDVHVIKQLWHEMYKSKVSKTLMERTIKHSKRYESMFRDRSEKIDFYIDKDLIMEEHAIMAVHELPADHPRITRLPPSYTIQKWNKAITALESKLPSAYNDVMFVLQHNDWYTDAGRNEMKRLAVNHPFTSNQKCRIRNPPSLVLEEDRYEDYCDYDGDY